MFYPALREHQEMQEMIDEATEEHAEVANLLEELQEMDKEKEDWSSKLAELKKNVLHHVKEEEGEIFNKAKEILERKKYRP